MTLEVCPAWTKSSSGGPSWTSSACCLMPILARGAGGRCRDVEGAAPHCARPHTPGMPHGYPPRNHNPLGRQLGGWAPKRVDT